VKIRTLGIAAIAVVAELVFSGLAFAAYDNAFDNYNLLPDCYLDGQYVDSAACEHKRINLEITGSIPQSLVGEPAESEPNNLPQN
jgi:hypothetical protein